MKATKKEHTNKLLVAAIEKFRSGNTFDAAELVSDAHANLVIEFGFDDDAVMELLCDLGATPFEIREIYSEIRDMD